MKVMLRFIILYFFVYYFFAEPAFLNTKESLLNTTKGWSKWIIKSGIPITVNTRLAVCEINSTNKNLNFDNAVPDFVQFVITQSRHLKSGFIITIKDDNHRNAAFTKYWKIVTAWGRTVFFSFLENKCHRSDRKPHC